MKPKEFDFEPQTLGEHIKRHRVIRGLTQRQAAQAIGVDVFTVLNWEKDRTEPPIRAMPAIKRFLGYDPYPQPKTLPDRLLAKRRAMGWTVKEAAHQLGVDEGTWGQWERGLVTPWKRYRALVEKFLA